MNIFGDKSIKSGDLAIVVRDCCGRSLGTPVKVAKIFPVMHPSEALCGYCRRTYSNIDVVEVADPGRLYYCPLFWLKKIDPPMEKATEKHDEEIHA